MDDPLESQKTFEDDDFPLITPEKLTPGIFLGENQNYRLEKLLGSGTFGQAWLAAEIEGGKELRKVVCKVLPALVQKEKDEMEKVICASTEYACSVLNDCYPAGKIKKVISPQLRHHETSWEIQFKTFIDMFL